MARCVMVPGMGTLLVRIFTFIYMNGFGYIRNGKYHRQQPGKSNPMYLFSFHVRFTLKYGNSNITYFPYSL